MAALPLLQLLAQSSIFLAKRLVLRDQFRDLTFQLRDSLVLSVSHHTLNA